MLIINFPPGRGPVRIFFVAAIILLGLLGGTVFIPRARIVVKVQSQPVVKTFDVLLDSDLKNIAPALSAIPVRFFVAPDMEKLKSSAESGWVLAESLIQDQETGVGGFQYRPSDLKLLSRLALEQELFEDNEIALSFPLEVTVLKAVPDFDTFQAILTIRAVGTSVPRLPMTEWRNLKYNNPEEIKRIIIQFPGVREVFIDIWPSFWPFMPYRSQNLQFSLDII